MLIELPSSILIISRSSDASSIKRESYCFKFGLLQNNKKSRQFNNDALTIKKVLTVQKTTSWHSLKISIFEIVLIETPDLDISKTDISSVQKPTSWKFEKWRLDTLQHFNLECSRLSRPPCLDKTLTFVMLI